MLLEQLRKEVLEANLEIVRRGLVIYTWGNASGFDAERGLMVIKPSGVPFDKLRAEDLVVTDLNGKTVEGTLKPSSDLDTHLELYRSFPGIGGIVHTHATHCVAWAQAGHPLPCLGTTHADHFYGPIPITDPLKVPDFAAYELNTGKAIVRSFFNQNPLHMPGVLVRSHGPFCWGPTPARAAMNAVIMEEIARIALLTLQLDPREGSISRAMLDAHFLRKHGPKATYGQG